MDKQDSTEQHLICEDHFLPEDISTRGSAAYSHHAPLPGLGAGCSQPLGARSPEGEGRRSSEPARGCDIDDEAAMKVEAMLTTAPLLHPDPHSILQESLNRQYLGCFISWVPEAAAGGSRSGPQAFARKGLTTGQPVIDLLASQASTSPEGVGQQDQWA
ncbi:transcription factor E2F1-like protein [Lates japonicus]|uniref:Transcription factor E2F1-like protein n=1 Tax=Lates japonicus TaxID=270547 RepID=A0AAD3R678_LATJO|nr:transcription factor E2F1-like protein [Lates japonicus]